MASAATITPQEQEVWEHSSEFESDQEREAAKSEESPGAQPSPEGKLQRLLSSASTTAAAWIPPALDDSLWAEDDDDDDDEGFSGWTPWTPASFKMTEADKTSDAQSLLWVDTLDSGFVKMTETTSQ